MTAPTQTVTYQQFFADVLTRIGAPVTNGNLDALAAVSVLEGANDRFNPLNSVQRVPGSSDSPELRQRDVQTYHTYEQGVEGTVALLQGNPIWRPVVAALQGNQGQSAVLNAFQGAYASWGSHVSFNASSGQVAQRLSATLGNGSPMSNTALHNYPSVPSNIDVHPLLGPISPAQEQSIVTWLEAIYTVTSPIAESRNPGFGTGTPVPSPTITRAWMNAGDQGNLISTYNSVYSDMIAGKYPEYQAQSVSVPPGIPGLSTIAGLEKSVLGAVDWLTNVKNWERIGMFALGGIILLVVAVEFSKGNT